MGDLVLPAVPNHDLCLGTVLDRDAPGGGWTCDCPVCYPGKEDHHGPGLWVPGKARAAQAGQNLNGG